MMLLARSVHLLMPLSIVLAFLFAPPAHILGETGRLIYFHVPVAWVSVLAFSASAVIAAMYLAGGKSRTRLVEARFHNSAAIGTLFVLLATATGSVWARLMWGSYWNWDPREISIALLLLVYAAYFSLRAALAGNPARGRLCAAYLILSAATVPFFVFVIPRIYPSLHPDPVINPGFELQLDSRMRAVLVVSLLSFSMLYLYLFKLANRLSGARIAIEEMRNEE